MLRAEDHVLRKEDRIKEKKGAAKVPFFDDVVLPRERGQVCTKEALSELA